MPVKSEHWYMPWNRETRRWTWSRLSLEPTRPTRQLDRKLRLDKSSGFLKRANHQTVRHWQRNFRSFPSVSSLSGTEEFHANIRYKQAASILGDSQFQSQRRYWLQQAVSHGLDKVWTYQFEQVPPGAAARLGCKC